MAQYNTLKIKLSNSQIDKFKSGKKTLKLSSWF